MESDNLHSITRSSVLKGYLKFIQEPSEVPSAPTRYESREARLQIYGSASLECAMSSKMTDPLHL